MSLPKVSITISNGGIGGIAVTSDGVVGIIVSAPVAPSGMTLGVAKRYTSLAAVEADGLTAAWDTAQGMNSHRQLSELYSIMPNAAVWIMPLVNTVVMADICNKADTNAYLKKLVQTSKYEVRVVGVCRVPDVAYTEPHTKGIDDDVINALVYAESYCRDLEAQGTPIAVIIEGRNYRSVAGDLESLKTHSQNHCGIVICGTSTTDKSASVGMVLGAIASLPVQRNIGRVRNGELPVTAAYLSNGVSVEMHPDLETIHDKGYITIRKFLTRASFYFTDDPLSTSNTDDFNTISRRRTINKAIMIAVDTYLDQINDEIEITVDGTIDPGTAKAIQAMIDKALAEGMKAQGNVSQASSFVDTTQNILVTNELAVQIRIIPKGQSKIIACEIGFVQSI